MGMEKFEYVRVAASAARRGLVGFELKRKDGTPFEVCLSVDDANQLVIDLRDQIRIASEKPS